MSNETQQAENSLKIRKAVLECEERMKNANPHNQAQGISFHLERLGYNAELLRCSKKDKKFSWRNVKGILYIQVSEPNKQDRFCTAYFVQL